MDTLKLYLYCSIENLKMNFFLTIIFYLLSLKLFLHLLYYTIILVFIYDMDGWITLKLDITKRFLLYDNEDKDRIIIFATNDSLKLLLEADNWFIDNLFVSFKIVLTSLYSTVQIGSLYIIPTYDLLQWKLKIPMKKFLNS